MGTWGIGLYAGDFASDLRSTVAAVSRLPFDGSRLTEIVAETEPSAARDPANDEYCTFWLVVADQFARRGIVSETARSNALDIIDSGRDIESQRRLGQTDAGLRKRGRILVELRRRLLEPPVIRSREVLREPQAFVMDVGDALVYPTCGGKPRNPYAVRPDQLKIYGPRGGQPWFHDGWGAIVIIDRGRAFDFLTWYRPIVVQDMFEREPDGDVLAQASWAVEPPGTCRPMHFKRMEMRKIGAFSIRPERVAAVFPNLRPGVSAAVSDISIANRMSVGPAGAVRRNMRAPYGVTVRLTQLA
jgi:hypothetical protein